VTFEKEI